MPLGGIAAYCSLAEHMQNIQDSHLLDDFQDHFHLPIVYCLVVWNIFYFPLWDVILPIDIHIFQRGRYTTNQYTKSLLGVAFQILRLRFLKILDVSAVLRVQFRHIKWVIGCGLLVDDGTEGTWTDIGNTTNRLI